MLLTTNLPKTNFLIQLNCNMLLNPNLEIVADNGRIEPYIELLFFLKHDPSSYQKDNFEVSNENYYVSQKRNQTKMIGNIITRPINWKIDLSEEKYLLGDALAISEEQINVHKLDLVKEITLPNGEVVFRMVKTNPHLKKDSTQAPQKGKVRL